MSRPNLLKYGQVTVQDDNTRVIDSNERVAERIAQLSQRLQSSLEPNAEGEFADGFSDGIEAAQVSALLDDNSGSVIKAEPVYDGPSPEELIADAQNQADELLANARAEAEALKEQIMEQAKEEGRAQGYQIGCREAEDLKKKLQAELAEKETRLTEIYREKMEELEPELIDTLTDIYEHIFQVKFSDYKEVVVHLIGNTLRKIDGSSEYLIHISKEDYPYVSMQKEALLEAGGVANANFNIVEDMTLKKNQCLIETESGIFDCSLGVELKELKKQLLLLAYEGKDQTYDN